MEVTLKRLTKNGAFAYEVLFLTQQKAYSFGRTAENDVVLFAPAVSKNHCIFHHNTNGLFVEVLKSSAGVVVNGKKYSTGSTVRLQNKDLVGIGLHLKYQVEIKPIVQDFYTEANFTSDFETRYESIKEEDLSDMNINNQSELKDATGGIKNTDYEETLRSLRRDESFDSEASIVIKEELTFEETQEISLEEIHSTMQITIDKEDLKPFLPLNSTGEALTAPNIIAEISSDMETMKLSEFSNSVREETLLRSQRMAKGILQRSCEESFKNRVSEKTEQNNISLKENEAIDDQIFKIQSQISKEQSGISKEQSRMFKEKNIVSNKESEITPKRISGGISGKQFKIVLERLRNENSENTVKSFQTHSVKKLASESMQKYQTNSVRKLRNDCVRKLGNDSVRKFGTESSSPKRKLKTESVKKFETNFELGIDSLKNLATESPAKTNPEINSSLHEKGKKLESSKQKILAETKKCFPSTKNMKYCQKEEKRLSVTLIDILKNPISDFPSMRKLPSNSENVNEEPKMSNNPRKSGPPIKSQKYFVTNPQLQENLEPHIKNRLFSCDICEKTFKSKSSIVRHLMIQSRVRRQTCGICKKILCNKTSLEYHMRTHTANKLLKCEKCLKLFFRDCDLQNHMKIHANAKQYKCLHCDKSYNVKTALNTHDQKNHRRKELYECNECDKKFRWKYKLVVHLRIHTGERPFVCKVCAKTFRGIKARRRHLRSHVGKFTCNECEETFPNKSSLRGHLSIHQRNICPECGYVAPRPGKLLDHLRIHTGEKPFVCQVCERTFRRKTILWFHMRSHEVKYTCNECEETFFKKSKLMKHLKIHFPKRRTICPECGYGAYSKTHLVNHRRVHTGEKPFKCEVCDKAFAVKGTLRDHMMRHTEEYPYRCKMCGTGFRRPHHLKVHYISHGKRDRSLARFVDF